METYLIRIIATLVLVVFGTVLHILVKLSLKKARKKYGFQEKRSRIILKGFDVSNYTIIVIIILSIWGIDEKKLALFLSSFVAVLGVTLFAQWSILSNITASIILFINHPAKIGDQITFLDKDIPLTGEIMDIGAFFIIIKTDQNELITIANTLIFQKMVKIISKEIEEL